MDPGPVLDVIRSSSYPAAGTGEVGSYLDSLQEVLRAKYLYYTGVKDRITVSINGEIVNECFDVFPSSGRILLQNEGNEIYFNKFELYPLMDP